MRVNKFLATAGLGSRRKVEDLIVAKKVLINGKVAKLGDQVDENRDKVVVEGKMINLGGLEYYLFYKPIGVLSTSSDTHSRRTVADFFPDGKRLFVVGRLDMDSEGLMILTNDGELSYRITHPKFQVEKEYEVLVSGLVGDVSKKMVKGFEESGEWLKAKKAEVIHSEGDKVLIRITLTEGKKREIRRMVEHLGGRVLRLIRVRIGKITLGKLKEAEVRKIGRPMV